jgi:hypothetical protein
MTLLGRLGAIARGDVSTADLAAFGSGTADAYGLIDQLPAEGLARLSAWCAFVLQTYADNLLSSGASPGYAAPETYDQARVLYELVGAWLVRARAAAASEAYRPDVVVPQPLPHSPAEIDNGEQVAAMRKTLEAVQTRAGADLAARPAGPLKTRLEAVFESLQTTLDASSVLAHGRPVEPGLAASLAQTLHETLDRAYQLGQLLSVPSLLDEPLTPPDAAPEGSTSVQFFLPGDARFDPWCLTDPACRRRLAGSATAAADLDALWAGDPEPARTLAVQAQIVAAVDRGDAAYVPDGAAGTLETLAEACPWPRVLYANADLVVCDTRVGRGERFVLTVGGHGTSFERSIAKLPVPPDDR